MALNVGKKGAKLDGWISPYLDYTYLKMGDISLVPYYMCWIRHIDPEIGSARAAKPTNVGGLTNLGNHVM